MSFIKKVPVSTGRTGKGEQPLPVEGLTKYQALVEFLALHMYDDGSPREPGTVTFFYQDGAWKAAINDKDQRRTAYATAATPLRLVALLEEGLREDKLDWRAWKREEGAKKRK